MLGVHLLPLWLSFLGQATVFSGSFVAAQQCHLKVPSKNLVNSSGGLSNTAGPGITVPPSTSSPASRSVSTSSGVAPTSTSTSATTFDYNSDKIRGVNLYVESSPPWITPSVFENTNNDAITDEYTLGQLLDSKTASNILQQHWSTWITEDDFVAISSAGLNHVRIPLGYWSVPLTPSDTDGSTSVAPYTPGAWPYLLKGLEWAKKHSINVILDIHGAPGSQNGYDNSGQRTSNPVWALNPANVSRTIDTLRYIVENIGGLVDVIELLNEPAGFRGDHWAQVIAQFWLDGYDAVRQAGGAGIKVMIGDAFLGVQHEYQIFSDLELDRSMDQHVEFACTYSDSLSAYKSSNIWTIIGEWSNAMTDCAKWLNGRGVGARWDGTWSPGNSQYHGSCTNYTGSYTGFSNSYKTFLRKYWEVQVEIGENVSGWVFWTWKAENADDWSYQMGLQGGWIPQDPGDRQYPGLCS
ncbi:hypothetical protein DXG01_005256 [Tephrocybe rancida]|nr:hypothetical protein DXG01_005256 [Tephrocybe rancida]